MNRRGFLIGLMAAGTVVATCAKPPGAEAAPLTPKTIDDAAKALDAVPGEAAGTETQNQYWGYRRHWRPRRHYYYRRRYYRPRFYYRPRRHYYYRPRFYRRRYGW